MQGGFAYLAPYGLGRTPPIVRLAYPPVSPHPQTVPRWHRILNRLSFAYAFRPRLRSRLTLGGRAFPRKPWAFGEGDSHPFSRLLMPAFSLPTSPEALSSLPSPPWERSPTISVVSRQASVVSSYTVPVTGRVAC